MTEIIIKIDPIFLREIYFGKNEHRYFFGPNTKKQSLYLILSIVIYPFFTWYSINLKDDWIFVLGTVLLSLFLYDFLRVAKPIIKWKKSVNVFIEETKKTNILKVLYDENCFWHIQDKVESKLAWTEINNANINEKLIWLFTSNTNFLLPKKSMKQDEFYELSKMIMDKVKNVYKN